jgi:dihydrofolate synthase/folylpolyglutamate synthase
MFARKDAVGFFAPFKGLAAKVLATTFDSPNAASADDIAQAARQADLAAETVSDVSEGVRRALEGSGPAPHVLVCGGLHFAGEVLAMSPDTWPT